MKTKTTRPVDVIEAIHREGGALMERPAMQLPEDRQSFLKEVPAQHQTEAEAHWDMLAEQDECREREWRQRHPEGKPLQTKTPTYFLAVPQIASRWNVSERTVWRLVKSGRLPSRRLASLRRVLEADVEAFEAGKAVA